MARRCWARLLPGAAVLTLTGMGAQPSLPPFDRSHPFVAIRRLQHSSSPVAKAITRQIREGPRDLRQQIAAARREGLPLTPRELRVLSSPPALDAAPIYARLFHLLRERPLIPE